jgi:hypothetical protein
MGSREGGTTSTAAGKFGSNGISFATAKIGFVPRGEGNYQQLIGFDWAQFGFVS